MGMRPIHFAPSGEHAGGVSYWYDAARPLPTLLFVLPLILVYELGVFWFDAPLMPVRNGADCWMRSWALDAGLVHPWILPVLLLTVLGTWHIAGRHPWRCSFDTLTGMAGESLLFALLLIVAGQSLNLLFHRWGIEAMQIQATAADQGVRAVSFLGAGIYEELMFRLLLLPVCYFGLRAILLPRTLSAVASVFLTSVIFAAAHYLEPSASLTPATLAASIGQVCDDPSQWYGFAFRLLAGIAFAALFLLRGFGITVGCHAVYDLIVGILMQPPSSLS